MVRGNLYQVLLVDEDGNGAVACIDHRQVQIAIGVQIGCGDAGWREPRRFG